MAGSVTATTGGAARAGEEGWRRCAGGWIEGGETGREGGGAEGDRRRETRAFGLGLGGAGCFRVVRGWGWFGPPGGRDRRFRSFADGSIRGQPVLAAHWLQNYSSGSCRKINFFLLRVCTNYLQHQDERECTPYQFLHVCARGIAGWHVQLLCRTCVRRIGLVFSGSTVIHLRKSFKCAIGIKRENFSYSWIIHQIWTTSCENWIDAILHHIVVTWFIKKVILALRKWTLI